MMTGRERRFHFAAGALLSAVAFGVVALAVVLWIGPGRVGRALSLTGPPAARVDIPPQVHADLQRAGAIAENFEAFAVPPPHQTFFVQPDATLGYTLRPNASADIVVLTPRGDFSLELPKISLPSGAKLAADTEQFLSETAQLRFRYTADERGMRTTVPAVRADRQVLIVGDSVGFGVGVGDGDTVASHLQRLLPGMQVLNAAVPGYDGEQAAAVAEALSAERRRAALIYVACHNDFFNGDDPAMVDDDQWRQQVDAVVARLGAIGGRFDRVVIVLVTSLPYEARGVLQSYGWSDTAIRMTDELRKRLRAKAEAANIAFGEWSPIVIEERRAQQTVFAPFALYVDQAHLSPAGNALLARQLATLLGPAEAVLR